MKHIVCVGYAKCGTTMLDAVFRRSPLVANPREKKEIKYFLPPQYPDSDHYRKYLEQFDIGDREFTFEASPPYSHQSLADYRELLERIAATLPDSTIVICVRHPVVRAYSHYIHNLHAFALYGDGVHNARKLLPGRVFEKTFEQSAFGDGAPTSYADNLQHAYEIFGHSRVKLFFLEHDVARFHDWVADVANGSIADSLGLGEDPPKSVIPRRPVPNYAVRDGVLYAFGSRKGECVSYEGLRWPAKKRILKSRDAWTFEVGPEDIRRLANAYFREDLVRCSSISGDGRFVDYLTAPCEAETALLSSPALLDSLHGVPPSGRRDPCTRS